MGRGAFCAVMKLEALPLTFTREDFKQVDPAKSTPPQPSKREGAGFGALMEFA